MSDLGASPPAEILEEWARIVALHVDPVPHARNLALISIVLLAFIANAVVAGRFWIRGWIQRNLQLSDWLILVSGLGVLGIAAFAMAGAD